MATDHGFRHYHISVGPDGEPIELAGAEGEFVYLAVDSPRLRFCELHVMAAERMRERDFQRAFYEAAEEYSVFRHGLFPDILESGVDDGIPFYTVAYRDGEGLLEYLGRTGPQPAALALGMALALAEGLVAYRAHSEFHLPLGAGGFQVTRGSDGAPVFRVGDYGLAGASEKRHGAWEADFARSSVDVLELLLAGEPGNPGGSEGDEESAWRWRIDPERWVDAMGIREDLANFIVEARGKRHLRLGEVVSALRELLALAPGVTSPGKYRPEAGLADALVSHSGWKEVLGSYGAVMEKGGNVTTAVGRISSPGSVDREVRIHAMPPGDSLPEVAWNRLRAVRDLLGNPEECPALIRLFAVRPGGAAAHIAEEMVDGFSVAEMLAAHGPPPLCDSYQILQKTHLAMSQAEAMKLPVLGRLDEQVLLTFRGLTGLAGGAGPWAGAEVRLRTHPVLESLISGSRTVDRDGLAADQLDAFLGLADRLIRGGGDQLDRGTQDRIEQAFAEFGLGHGEGSGANDRESRKWSRGSFLRRIEGMARASERPGRAAYPVADRAEMASAEEFTDDPFADGGEQSDRDTEAETEPPPEGVRGSGDSIQPESGAGVKVAETTDYPTKKRAGWFRRK